MTRVRALFGFVLVAGGLGGAILISHGSAGPQETRRHVLSGRTARGYVAPAFRMLPGGSTPIMAGTGWLQGTWGQPITTTRASNKYCTYFDGGMVQLSSNQPCVDSNGVNVEPAATNLALQSQTFDNASWAIFSTLTVTANAAGCNPAPDGTTTADEINSTGGAIRLQGIAISASTQYTGSVWVRTKTGTQTTPLYIYDDAHSGVLATTSISATTAWTRYTVTGTFPAGSTTAQFGFNTGTYDICAWQGQLETGAVATSPIVTIATTATRAADQIVASGSFAVGPTPCFSADMVSSTLANTPQALAIYNASNDRWGMFVLSGGQLDCDYNNGTEFATITPSQVTAGVSAHLRCYYDGATLWACVNGVCSSSAKSFTPTATQSAIAIGYSGWSAQNWAYGDVSNVTIAATPGGCR